MERSSLFKMSGLPDAFGVILLVLSLVLLLAPYFSGTDFGQLRIPLVNEGTKKVLKIIGPVIFLSCVLFFVPFFRDNKQGASITPPSSAILPTSSGELAATPINVAGEKRNTNASNSGNPPVNASNESAKTRPSSPQTTNNSSTCTESDQIIHIWDDGPYEGNAPSFTEFPISKPVRITNIYTRHRGWRGIPPPGASFRLLDSSGKELGSCKVHSDGEEWVCSLNIQLPIGTYRVIDPDPATWSQNAGSRHMGMILLTGCPN